MRQPVALIVMADLKDLCAELIGIFPHLYVGRQTL